MTKLGAVLLGVLLPASAWVGCASSPPPSAGKAPAARAVNCGVDETREFFCDDLLPLNASLPAPAPFESCPSSVDNPVGDYDPAPPIAVFDTSFTIYTRKRSPPGHSCCYSWCSRLKLADPSTPSAQTACQTASAFREEYCIPELESGTSMPTASPYDRCPAALVPPQKAVFSPPEAALFDPTLTATHRGKGQTDCCYSWCSQAPPGSGLQRKR